MVVVLLAACLGCESNSAPSAPPAQLAAPPPPQPATAKPADAADAAAEPADGAPAEEPGAQPAPAAAAQPAAAAPAAAVPVAPPADGAAASADGAELKKAEVGVGVKGRDYGGPGFVTTPVMAKFSTEQRIAFEIQIPNAMKIYKAAHDNKGPKTHEEFMNVIIKEHGVQLPDLPQGETYLYIPKTEELMVKVPQVK
jgi:hypothetical protein